MNVLVCSGVVHDVGCVALHHRFDIPIAEYVYYDSHDFKLGMPPLELDVGD